MVFGYFLLLALLVAVAKKKNCNRNQIVSRFFFTTLNILTIRRSVFIGCRRVSLIRRAGGFFGFELGVCTAQHLINIPMKIINMMPMQMTAYQFSVTQCATLCKVCLLRSKFLRRTSGPSASTARHLRKTSQ